MSEDSTLRTIAVHLGRVFAPVTNAVSSVGAFRSFCVRLGFNVDAIPPQYTALVGDVTAILQAIENDDVDGLVSALFGLGQALGAGFPTPDGVVNSGAGKRLVDLLITDYLSANLPTVFSALRATGVVETTSHPAQGTTPAYVERSMAYDQIADFLSNPLDLVKSVVAWGEANFLFSLIADYLMEFLVSRGFHAHLEKPDPTNAGAYLDQQGTEPQSGGLVVDFVQTVIGGAAVDAGVELLALPAPNPGFVIQPLIPSQIDVTLGGNVSVQAASNVAQTFGLIVRPGADISLRYPFEQGTAAPSASVSLVFSPPASKVLLGSASSTRLEVSGAKATVGVAPSGQKLEFLVDLETQGAKLTIAGGDGDGFISGLIGGQQVQVPVDVTLRWSSLSGISFGGSGKFEISFAPNLQLGPIKVTALRVSVSGQNSDPAANQPAALLTEADADIVGQLGPVAATIQGLGVDFALGFGSGSLGVFDLSVGFKTPNGVGIAIDAGSVHGGGFISFDKPNSRYVGALQLSVYDIAVNAFGLLETKLPTGSGYSFVIIISAQFTPIQLGFGFTLNGVGGMVGINRGIDTTALATLVRAGQSEELLFPKNVVADAPTIVRDLTSVFPATQGHYVFGPLGKLGWGTPTLITGEIGVILEIPGPVVVLLGEVKCLLPKPDAALVKLNLSVDGELDFPNKLFSMDASLHDSVINGFPVSGQMAMRVGWGDQPNFVFSIGGFHPAYTPPPNFPKLQPMTLDLGSHGPAKISVSGFFAVTSNTVQVGGSASLHAGGSGITLDASVSVKALFVFQPFSFEADIDASVKISFHGYGPSVHLSGTLDGPSPWHIKGEVCVSIIWWDACLGFDVTFGGDTQVTQPSLDPWEDDTAVPGTPPAILRLKDAFSDPGNWSGAQIPGTVSSVTRAQGTDTLVDPAGGLTVRQKVAPVETANPLTKFGVAKTPAPVTFSGVQATLGTGNQTVSLTAVQAVNEPFAPAQFFDMDDGKKLSSAGYEQYQAGYLFATTDGKNAEGGSTVTFTPQLQTFVINSDGSDTLITGPAYKPTDTKVAAFNKRSAVAKGGLTLAGTRRFVNRAFTPSFTERLPTFVIGDSTTLAVPTVAPPAPAARSATLIALDVYRAQHVELAPNVQVTALYDMPNPPTA